MIKICFVCHGNICRSPMAEFVMKKLVNDAGLESEFYITSRATHTDEIWNGVGSPIYPPAREELFRHKIPFDREKRAQLLTKEDASKYNLFIGTDDENIRYMNKILGRDAEGKIFLLMSFAGEDRDVSDPWYTRNFSRAYHDIYKGCAALLNTLKEDKI